MINVNVKQSSRYLQSDAYERFYRPSLGDALGAVAEETRVHNPTTALIRSIESIDLGEKMQPEEAQSKYGIGNLKFDSPVSEDRAKEMYDMKLAEMRRNELIARAPQGIGSGAAKFGTALLHSIYDPINIASAFVPSKLLGVGAKSIGAATPRLAQSRAGMTMGQRARYGAAEGALGAALVEPLPYLAARRDQLDYTALDSFLNVALGGVMGAGFGLAGGALAKYKQSKSTGNNVMDVISELDVNAQKNLVDTAIAQVVNDKRVKNVDAAIRGEMLKTIQGDFNNLSYKINGGISDSNVKRLQKFDSASPVAAIPDQRFPSRKKADAYARKQKGKFLIQTDAVNGDYIALKMHKNIYPVASLDSPVRKFKSFDEARKFADELKASGKKAEPISFQEKKGASRQNHIVLMGVDDVMAKHIKSNPDYISFYNPLIESESKQMNGTNKGAMMQNVLAQSDNVNKYNEPVFTQSIEDDFFTDMDALREIDEFERVSIDTRTILNDADQLMELTKYNAKAMGIDKEYSSLIDQIDLEIKESKDVADAYNMLGACMMRKG